MRSCLSALARATELRLASELLGPRTRGRPAEVEYGEKGARWEASTGDCRWMLDDPASDLGVRPEQLRGACARVSSRATRPDPSGSATHLTPLAAHRSQPSCSSSQTHFSLSRRQRAQATLLRGGALAEAELSGVEAELELAGLIGAGEAEAEEIGKKAYSNSNEAIRSVERFHTIRPLTKMVAHAEGKNRLI